MKKKKKNLGLALILTFPIIAVAAVACSGPDPNTGGSAKATTCPDKRPQLNCESEVAYQGVKTEGGVHVLNVGASGAFANTALRQINQNVEGYIAGQTRLCREYNSCIVTPDQYHAEAEKARAGLAPVAPLVAKVNSADDPRERANAADQILTTVTKKGYGPALSINVSLEADLPPTVGGGSIVVPQNYPLPTNARVAFRFGVSQNSYVYLFQVGADQNVSVLFPDDRMTTKNPLPANGNGRIPENGLRFKLDEKGLGTENVYIIASSRSMATLEGSLRRFQSGELTRITQDPLLAEFAGVNPGKPCAKTRDLKLEADDGPTPAARSKEAAPAMGCTNSRGLVLDAAPQANVAVTKSLEARAAAGDDTIVKVFRFQHVTEPDYKSKLAEYNAPTPSGMKTRGIAIEN
jgi:hypothetical protein